jgi:hypothetical protein
LSVLGQISLPVFSFIKHLVSIVVFILQIKIRSEKVQNDMMEYIFVWKNDLVIAMAAILNF